MRKKNYLFAAIASLMCAGGYFAKSATTPNDGLSDLELANAEALADGIEVVGCKAQKDATCYVFSNGQLIDRRKNQYPGN